MRSAFAASTSPGGDRRWLLGHGHHPGHPPRRHRGQHRRRPPRRRHAEGALRAQAGLPPRRYRDRGQLLRAQRRGRRGRDDVRHHGETAGPHPLARIVSTGVSGLSQELVGLGPVDASRRALARAGLTTDDIDQVEINERSRPRSSRRPATWASPRTSSTSTAVRAIALADSFGHERRGSQAP